MNRFVIQVIGHLRPDLKPEALPDEVRDYTIVPVSKPEEVTAKEAAAMIAVIKIGGMYLLRDQYRRDTTKLDTGRLFIPMSMFSYIESHTSLMTGEEPIF